MLTRYQYAGGCHCGAISIELSTGKPAQELTTRLCQCAFCRKHGARAFSQSSAHAVIVINEPRHLQCYRFGLATADVALCRQCGVYVAMVLRDEGDAWTTINIETLEERTMFTLASDPVDFSNEGADERIRRRKAQWMPTTLVGWPG